MTSFIYEHQIEDTSICDEIIQYFKQSNNKTQGKIYKDSVYTIDETIKASTDVYLDPCPLAEKYCIQLQKALDEYINIYEFSGKCAEFGLVERINIQQYLPSQGFHMWHSERMHGNGAASSRHLVFMTYLNDVNDGGETEFYYQQIKIKPKKGKIVIFPTDWTHTHRGITSKTEEKYITTGWFNFK